MEVIEIKQSINLHSLDNYYSKYLKESKNDKPYSIVLPKKIENYFFSLNVSLIQFVASLFKNKNLKEIKFNIDSSFQDELSQLYDQEYTFPIVSYLWNEVEFLDKNGINLKGKLREFQNDFVLNMRSLNKMKGNKILLLNIDHFSEEKGILKFFETSTDFNPDEDYFIKTISKVFSDDILFYNKNTISEFNEVVYDVGAIIYELMKNTFEWAKTDKNNVPINPSIRGLYLRFYKKGKSNILKEYPDSPLYDFFNNNSIQVNNKNEVYFCEISVFDTGLGFVERYFSPGDEIEIIKKCLIKNHTSSQTLLKDKKGLGLDRILKILDRKGLFKISTHKYSLFRNLLKDPYKQIDINNLSDVVLNDWNQSAANSIKPIPVKYTGTTISILYPFKQKSNA